MHTGNKQKSDDPFAASIESIAAGADFQPYLHDLLLELCSLDTSPSGELQRLAGVESDVFDIIERECQSFKYLALKYARQPVNPDIDKHPFLTPLYYTGTKDKPSGLDVSECYNGRSNLIASVDGAGNNSGGVNQAFNVHIDVVAPYFAPGDDGEIVHGRGACDDKGNVVALLGALKILDNVLSKLAIPINRNLTCMFVIDEETGGNGSLSCALDRQLKSRYDSLMVLECTNGRLHPGNRGCVWYKIEGNLPDANLFEAAAFIIEELELEGRAIRAESDHPLFPHRPVQTCHGIIGHYGEHPSCINGDVSIRIDLPESEITSQTISLIEDILADGLEQYIALYGDKTKDVPGIPGSAKIERHYDIAAAGQSQVVRVYGATGHMGAIRENDGAITKMATLVRALVRSRGFLERAAKGPMTLSLEGWPDSSRLLMEGGQGFVPVHTLEEIERRLREAVHRGAHRYFDLMGLSVKPEEVFRIGYEKLHNAAFSRSVDSPDMINAVDAAKASGLPTDENIVGWDVSCDARIFACEYPSMPVITAGAGALEYAHSTSERISVNEISQMAVFLTHFILKQTGTALVP